MYGGGLGFVALEDFSGLIVENPTTSSRWWEEPLETIAQAGAGWVSEQIGGADYGSSPPFSPGDQGGVWTPPYPIDMSGAGSVVVAQPEPRSSELVNALTWGALALIGAKLVGVI